MLACFLKARDIHRISQKDNNSRKSELESDVWQLYSTFIHKSAPNGIILPDELSERLRRTIEGDTPECFFQVAEDLYKEIYHQLHYTYVVPFCQSENYLGYLCGAPPDVEELMRRHDSSENLTTAKRKNSAMEAPFSLTQFRNKIFAHMFGSAEAANEPGMMRIEPRHASADIGDTYVKWSV
jgi:hypothetical protein